MISKVIIGKTFYGACRYICKDTKRAIVLKTEGIRSYDYKLMAEDFERQHAFRNTLSKAVFHGIISFYPREKIKNEIMTEIAKEYLKELKVINTQFKIVKHIDKNHLHLHILANLVDSNGEVIKDNWIGLGGKKIAQKLTKKYKLKQALTKDISRINLEALNEKEANKYIIYQLILETLPKCKNLDDLKERLEKKKIETLYKYKGQTTELQGISFKIGNYKYKGSEIDRKCSVKNIQKAIYDQKIKGLLQSPVDQKYSKILFQNSQPGMNKPITKERSLLVQIMKPEQRDTALSSEWRLEKKKKKKSKRMCL